MYARRTGDRTLTMGVSGKLWRDVLVLYDRETDSLWSQLDGTAIRGRMTGQKLEEIPSELSTWAAWKRRHPRTAVLKKSAPVRGSEYAGYADDPTRYGVFGSDNPDPRLEGKAVVYGVQVPDGPAVAVTAARLEADAGVVVALGEEDAVLVARSPAGGVTAHRLRDFPAADVAVVRQAKNGRLVLSDGSVADTAEGRIDDGPGKGARLERLPVTRAYWFAWAAFHPRTRIVGLPGSTPP